MQINYLGVLQRPHLNRAQKKMSSFFWGTFGGVIAWMTTAIIGQPFYKFVSLRAEAARVLALYDRHSMVGLFNYDGLQESKLASAARDRKRDYESVGAQLIGFTAANVVLTSLLHHPYLGKYRCYLKSAGDSLIVLGNCPPNSPAAIMESDQIISALKLKF